jgi:DNA-binding winged helix-turn-helix (wHTH) protein/tetratricopeptide (TPR) repeat protein
VSEPLIQISDGHVDLQRRQVHRARRQLGLTEIEADLLRYFAAHPEQSITRTTLLTEVWGYHPDMQTRAVDAAVRRLRTKIEADPAAPRHLLTVRGVGYRFSPAAPGHHLVGRSALIEQLAQLRGWITLVGPGGVGKTALVRTFAGACFVDLSPARSQADCLIQVAAALRVPLVRGAPTPQIEALGHALAAQARPLLILDNVEQILPAIAQCVPIWRREAPQTTIMCTSRAAVGVAEEHVLTVPPLPPADARVLLTRLTPAGWADHPAIEPLIQRLDRLPLALELAAGRAGLLTPEQMLARVERLSARLDAPRQGSLAASVAWSWDLLTPAAQAGLAAASTFAGRFDVDAAEAVLPVPEIAVDVLEELTEKHLLRQVPGGFALLETIRAFAARRLPATDLAWVRFGRWCLAGPPQLDNLRRGFDALEVHVPALALELGVRATALLLRDGTEAAHHAYVERCAALVDPAHPARAAITAALNQADLHRRRARVDEGLAQTEVALQMAQALRDADGVARALSTRANLAHYARHADAEARWQTAISASAEASLTVRAEAFRGWANLLIDQGRLAECDAAYTEALHCLRLAGDTAAEAVVLGSRGILALEAGDYPKAHAALTRACRLHEAADDARFAAVAQTNLAQVAHVTGQLDAARQHALKSLGQHRRMGNRRFEGFARYILAALDHEQGDLESALAQLTTAMGLWRAVDERRFAGYGACRLALLEAARGDLAMARLAAEQAQATLQPADAAFAGWAIEGGPLPQASSCFARICLRLIDPTAR